MITFVDLAPMPHVRLLLTVPVPLPAGGWTWGQSGALPGELAREYAYNDSEVTSLVHTYGRMVPTILKQHQLGDRFRICAVGVATELVVGMREWQWVPDRLGFWPTGDYVSGWREAVRAFYRATGEYFEDKRFSARCGLSLSCEPDKRRPVVRLNAIPSQPTTRERLAKSA